MHSSAILVDFFKRSGMRKLCSRGWDYVTARLIAPDIAEYCYLARYDITFKYCGMPQTDIATLTTTTCS